MFKLGVHSARQLRNGSTTTVFGKKKKVSVTLLDKFDDRELTSDAYASILFCLNDDRGAFKRTYASRFDEFDDQCIEIMLQHFRRPALKFHDVAVSSGETSVDLFEKLRSKYDELSYLASDYDPYFTILNQGPLYVTISSSGSILEILLPPFVFSKKPPDRWFYPINRLLFFITREFWAKSLVARYLNAELSDEHRRTINIFCPKACQLANSDQGFMLGQQNLLTPSEDTFDCVRAMNVLNNSYFSARQMQTILLNTYNSLTDNGILIAGSNQTPGSPVTGAVYVKNDQGFDKVWTTVQLPEVDEHVGIFNGDFG